MFLATSKICKSNLISCEFRAKQFKGSCHFTHFHKSLPFVTFVAKQEEVTTVTTTQQPQPQQVVQVQQRQNVQHVQRAVAQEEPQHTRAVIVDLPSYGQRAIYDASYVPARRVERMQPQQQQQDYEQQHEYTRQYQRRRADFVPRAPPREFPAWSSRRQYQDQGEAKIRLCGWLSFSELVSLFMSCLFLCIHTSCRHFAVEHSSVLSVVYN